MDVVKPFRCTVVLELMRTTECSWFVRAYMRCGMVNYDTVA